MILRRLRVWLAGRSTARAYSASSESGYAPVSSAWSRFLTASRFHVAGKRSIVSDDRGVALIEFAILVPLLLTLYFGTIEVTDAISADRQTALVASTVAEITSQYTSLASNDVSNIMAAASSVLTPFPVANVKVTLSSVRIDTTGAATVDWSVTLNGSVRSGTVTTSIPAALRPASAKVSYIIWGEATYNYKPLIGYVVTGTLSMYSQIFVAPRQSVCVLDTVNGGRTACT